MGDRKCKKKADAAVISSDSMVYGSLVASRKHNLSEDVVLARVHNFEKKYIKQIQI